MKERTLYAGFFVMAGLLVITTPFIAYHAVYKLLDRQAGLPAQAAEEAKISCAAFSGLHQFFIEKLEDQDGLNRYRVSSVCLSGHKVQAEIGLSIAKPAESPASAAERMVGR